MSTEYHMTRFIERKMAAGESLDAILKQSKKNDLGSYLSKYICKKNISIEVTAELAGINKTSLYRIINGTSQNPGFNLLIRISRVLELDYDQTQHLLKLGNSRALSGGRQRDIIIMHGIRNKMNIADLDELLTNYGMVGLFAK